MGFFRKHKMSVDSLPKNQRGYTLSNIVSFFHGNLDVIKDMEKHNVLPVTNGIGLSTIAEDLITGYVTEQIIDLDEVNEADEVQNGKMGRG